MDVRLYDEGEIHWRMLSEQEPQATVRGSTACRWSVILRVMSKPSEVGPVCGYTQDGILQALNL